MIMYLLLINLYGYLKRDTYVDLHINSTNLFFMAQVTMKVSIITGK